MFTEHDLARTYSPPSYEDAYDVVRDYQRVAEYRLSHPDAGSTAIARALDLPRSRIRPWLDGAIPDPVRAIQRARDNGWVDASVSDSTGGALNILVAAALSGGSVSRSYEPRFVAGTPAVERAVREALETLTLGVREVNSDVEGRARELTPDSDRMLLGRVLAVIGVPIGPKTRTNLSSLPAYLDDAPASERARFAEVYAANRGTQFEQKDTLGIREKRNQAYLRDLAAFLEDVTGESASPYDRGIILSAAAARKLGLGRDGSLRL